jgi:hypothetical protein
MDQTYPIKQWIERYALVRNANQFEVGETIETALTEVQISKKSKAQDNKVIRKVILSFIPCPLCFHPLSPISVVSPK